MRYFCNEYKFLKEKNKLTPKLFNWRLQILQIKLLRDTFARKNVLYFYHNAKFRFRRLIMHFSCCGQYFTFSEYRDDCTFSPRSFKRVERLARRRETPGKTIARKRQLSLVFLISSPRLDFIIYEYAVGAVYCRKIARTMEPEFRVQLHRKDAPLRSFFFSTVRSA